MSEERRREIGDDEERDAMIDALLDEDESESDRLDRECLREAILDAKYVEEEKAGR
jgi:hypothetical protein